MKKSFLLIGLLLIAAVHSFAQQSPDSLLVNDDQVTKMLLSQQRQRNVLAKPTILKQRVILQTRSLLGGGVDSIAYQYGNSERGSYFVYPEIMYPVSLRLNFWELRYEVQPDYLLRGYNEVLNMGEKETFVYNPDNNPDAFYRFEGRLLGPSFPPDTTRRTDSTFFQYDTEKLLIRSQFSNRSFRRWYNTDQTPSIDTAFENDTVYVSAVIRHYTNGKLDTVTRFVRDWSWPDYRYVATYYPDGNLQTARSYVNNFGPGGERLSSLDSFGYTPGAKCYTYRKRIPSFSPNGNASGLMTTIVYPNIANGYPDSMQLNVQVTNSTYTRQENTYFYVNTFGNPDSIRIISTTESPNINRFFYEEHEDGTPPTSIRNKDLSQTISISPNPFQDHFFINYSGAVSSAPFHIKLINLSGQVVINTTKKLSTGSNSFSVPNSVPPGLYLLSIQSETEKFTYKLLKE